MGSELSVGGAGTEDDCCSACCDGFDVCKERHAGLNHNENVRWECGEIREMADPSGQFGKRTLLFVQRLWL